LGTEKLSFEVGKGRRHSLLLMTSLYTHTLLFFVLTFFCYRLHYEEEVSDELQQLFNKHTDYHEQSIEGGRQDEYT
jgi:hypothetical protein